MNSRQVRHSPTASTEPCVDISHTDHTRFHQFQTVPNGSSQRSSCTRGSVCPPSSPCCTTASMPDGEEDCLGSLWFHQPPLTQQKMGPAPMPVVFCWGGTDPADRGLVVTCARSVKGTGPGAKRDTRDGGERKTVSGTGRPS